MFSLVRLLITGTLFFRILSTNDPPLKDYTVKIKVLKSQNFIGILPDLVIDKVKFQNSHFVRQRYKLLKNFWKMIGLIQQLEIKDGIFT